MDSPNKSLAMRTLLFPYRGVNAHFRDDVTNWKHFPRYWPFVGGIHRVNNGEAGGLRIHRAQYDVTVMSVEIYN